MFVLGVYVLVGDVHDLSLFERGRWLRELLFDAALGIAALMVGTSRSSLVSYHVHGDAYHVVPEGSAIGEEVFMLSDEAPDLGVAVGSEDQVDAALGDNPVAYMGEVGVVR